MIFLTHEFAPFHGGAGIYVQETAAAAARLGLPAAVWTVDYGKGGRRKSKKDGAEDEKPLKKANEAGARQTGIDSTWNFPVVRLPSSGRLSPVGIGALAWGIWRRRARLRGETVYLLSVGAHLAFAVLQALGLLRDIRTVCFFHGSEVLKFQRGSGWRGLVQRLYARAGGFAVASRYVQGLVRESGLLPAGSAIVLAPCACPTTLRFRSCSETPPPSARDTTSKLRVLTVARLHPRKGQLELAQALARLPSEIRARLIYQMVGAGEESYRAQVQQVCQTSGVVCEFLGALDDNALALTYARCDIYAQASRTLPRSVEGFGISFLEASQYGKPIAAFETGGVAEAVLDRQTGLLVPEGDTAALAAAIARLANDPALRARLGEGGRKHAASFSWEESARSLHQLERRR